MSSLRITVWNEFRHERKDAKVIEHYPKGIHEALAAPLRELDGVEVTTATLDEPEHGLSDARLEATDVLVWWSHIASQDLSDAIASSVATCTTPPLHLPYGWHMRRCSLPPQVTAHSGEPY